MGTHMLTLCLEERYEVGLPEGSLSRLCKRQCLGLALEAGISDLSSGFANTLLGNFRQTSYNLCAFSPCPDFMRARSSYLLNT